MIIHRMAQYSPEWWDIHRGVPSMSNCAKIITPKTGALSKQARSYMYELIAEPISQEEEESFEPTKWMQRGIELEAEARAWYEMKNNVDLDEVGFITNDEATWGCSPDSLTDTHGVEIKCPMAKTHVGYLLNGTLPDFYKPQVHGSMFITGLPWIFISYHPDFDPLVVSVEPDDYTVAVGKALTQFAKDLSAARGRLFNKEAA